MILAFITFLNIVFLLLAKETIPPVLLLFIDYLLIYFSLRNRDPLSPIYWFFFIWNFLFANTFSGIISYTLPEVAYYYIFIVFVFLLIFYLGFYLAKSSFKNSPHSGNTSCFKYFDTPFVLKMSKICAICCILASFLLMIDVILINRLNVLNPLELRDYVNNKTSGTMFAQLSALLFFGGLFSLINYPYIKKNRLLILISIITFLMGSILSAGRQQMFQVVLLFFVLLVINKSYKILISFERKEKVILIGVGILFVSYLVMITTKRNFEENNADINEFVYTYYETNNHMEYSSDFKWLIDKAPTGIQSVIVEMSFYFSHELVGLYERSQNNDYPLVDVKLLRLFPFIERQVDKIYVFGDQSQMERNSMGRTGSYNGYIDQTAWATIIHTSLMTCGLLGMIVFIFCHGYFSYIIYFNCKLMNEVLYFYANIGNILFILYTIMYNLFGDTPYLVFVVVLICLISIKRFKSRKHYPSHCSAVA